MTGQCPVCGGETATAFFVGDRNREIGSEVFSYRRCLRCGILHLADPPSDLGAHYPDDYYVLPTLHELDDRAEGEASKLALVRRFQPGGRLIDVGASYGLFARAAARAGYDVTAVEMNARCCEHLEQVVGVRAIRSNEPERALGDLDRAQVITLWHVLEHVPKPWKLLEAIAERLEPGGVLGISTPNPESFQFRMLGPRWAHVDAPRHLFLIPFPTLEQGARSFGLEVAHVTTHDPVGRQLNRMGWEYALRRRPGRGPAPLPITALSVLTAGLLSPIERGGLRGAAYTAAFVKSA
jgi:2-polyprenyl-3-methyl-5-hydroxy-6-metoxy-1,4-benzoquinol methylase